MDVFDFRDKLVDEYARFTRSFVRIRAADIKTHVDQEYAAERFWPAPMVQLNPAFVSGGDIGRFVAEGVLHPECERIFRAGKSAAGAPGFLPGQASPPAPRVVLEPPCYGRSHE